MQIPIEKIQILQLITDYKNKEEIKGIEVRAVAETDEDTAPTDISISVGATLGGAFMKYSSLHVSVTAGKKEFIPHKGYNIPTAIQAIAPEIGIMTLSTINDFLIAANKPKAFVHPELSAITTNTFNKGTGNVGLKLGLTLPNILAEYSGLTTEIEINQHDVSFDRADLQTRIKAMLNKYGDTVISSLNKICVLLNKPTVNLQETPNA